MLPGYFHGAANKFNFNGEITFPRQRLRKICSKSDVTPSYSYQLWVSESYRSRSTCHKHLIPVETSEITLRRHQVAKVFFPITYDRNELETWGWCQCSSRQGASTDIQQTRGQILTRARPGVWATFARLGGKTAPLRTRKLRKLTTSGKRRWIGRGKFYKKYSSFFDQVKFEATGGQKRSNFLNLAIFAENRSYLNNYTS